MSMVGQCYLKEFKNDNKADILGTKNKTKLIFQIIHLN